MKKLILPALCILFVSASANSNETLTCKTKSYSDSEEADHQGQFGVKLQIDSAGNNLECK